MPINNNTILLEQLIQKIQNIPDAPSGEYLIENNGKYSIAQFASVDVQVPQGTDTSDATATEAEILYGYTAYISDGSKANGTCTYDADTKDADAVNSDILYDKTAYVNGIKITGNCTYDADTKDATATNVDILYGQTAYVNGSKVTGICTYDANTKDATAGISDILSGMTAYVNGSKVTGICTYDADTRDATAKITDLLRGKTAYANGAILTGACTYDADTKDATAVNSDILSGKTAYVNGIKVTGSCTYDADTKDATAINSHIIYGETAYVNGEKITGSAPNRTSLDITQSKNTVIIPIGFYDQQITSTLTPLSLSTPSVQCNIDAQNGIATITPIISQGDGYVFADSKQGTPTVITVSDITYGEETYIVDGTYDVTALKTVIIATGSGEDPTRDATAVDSDIVYNRTAYAKGSKLVGTIQQITSISVQSSSVSQVSNNYNFSGKYSTAERKYIDTNGSTVVISVPTSNFGNALSSDVVVGKTYTSSNGLNQNGSLIIQHYYIGDSDPSDNFGDDGDLFLKVVP